MIGRRLTATGVETKKARALDHLKISPRQQEVLQSALERAMPDAAQPILNLLLDPQFRLNEVQQAGLTRCLDLLIGYYHTIGVRTNQLNPTAMNPKTTPDMLFTRHTFNYLASLGITPHSYRTIENLNELPKNKQANITRLINHWKQPTPFGQMKSQEHTILTTALSLARVVRVSMRTEDFGDQSLQQSILSAPKETAPAFMSPTKMAAEQRDEETSRDYLNRVAQIVKEMQESTEAFDAAFEEDQAKIQVLPQTTARAVYNHLSALYDLQKKWDIWITEKLSTTKYQKEYPERVVKFYAAYSNLCTRVRMLEHQFLYSLENTRCQLEFSEIHLDGELMMPVEAIAMAPRRTFITTPRALQSFLSRNGIPTHILESAGLEASVIFNAMANVCFGMNPNCLSTHQCPQPLIDFVKEHQGMLREKRNAFANTFFTATKEEVIDVLSILPQGPKTVALAAIESGDLADINDPGFNQMLHERIARGAIEPMVVGDSFLSFFMETVNETMTLLESRPLIDGVAELQAGIRAHIILCFEKIMAIVYEKISSWTCPRDITTKSLQELSELSDAWESYYDEQMTLLRPFIGLLSKKHLHAFPEFHAIFNALHQISRMQHELKGALTNRAEQLMPEGILSMQMKDACHQHFDRMIEDLNAVELSKFTSFRTQLTDAIKNLMKVNDSHTEDIHTFCLFLGFPRDAAFTFEFLIDHLKSLRDNTGETMTFDMLYNGTHAFVFNAIEQIEDIETFYEKLNDEFNTSISGIPDKQKDSIRALRRVVLNLKNLIEECMAKQASMALLRALQQEHKLSQEDKPSFDTFQAFTRKNADRVFPMDRLFRHRYHEISRAIDYLNRVELGALNLTSANELVQQYQSISNELQFYIKEQGRLNNTIPKSKRRDSIREAVGSSPERARIRKDATKTRILTDVIESEVQHLMTRTAERHTNLERITKELMEPLTFFTQLLRDFDLWQMAFLLPNEHMIMNERIPIETLFNLLVAFRTISTDDQFNALFDQHMFQMVSIRKSRTVTQLTKQSKPAKRAFGTNRSTRAGGLTFGDAIKAKKKEKELAKTSAWHVQLLASDIAPTLALIPRDQPTINHAPAFNALVYGEQSDPPDLGVTFREFDPILQECPPKNHHQCHRDACQSTLRYLNLKDRYPEANEFALVAFHPDSATEVESIEAAIQFELFGHLVNVCEHKRDEDHTDPLKEMLNGMVNNTLIEGAKLAYLTSYFSYLIEDTSEIATCDALRASLLNKCEEISVRRTEFFDKHQAQILYGLKDKDPLEMDTLEMDKKRFEKFPSIYRPRAYKRPKTPDSFIVTLRDKTYENQEHHRNFLAKLKLS